MAQRYAKRFNVVYISIEGLLFVHTLAIQNVSVNNVISILVTSHEPVDTKNAGDTLQQY